MPKSGIGALQAEMGAPFNGDDVKPKWLLPGISVFRSTTVTIRPLQKIGGVIHTAPTLLLGDRRHLESFWSGKMRNTCVTLTHLRVV